MIKDWAIKARLIEKNKEIVITKSNRHYTLLPLKFIDAKGTVLDARLFGSRLETHESKLIVGQCYFIADGTLRAYNKVTKANHGKYWMTLTDRSSIKYLWDEDDVDLLLKPKSKFIDLNRLKEWATGTIVDVIGIPRQVYPPRTVKVKNGTGTALIKTFRIFNEDGFSIPVTLWEDKARISIEENLLTVFEDLKICFYSNRLQLNSNKYTNIHYDARDYNRNSLDKWITNNSNVNYFQHLIVPQSLDEILVVLS